MTPNNKDHLLRLIEAQEQEVASIDQKIELWTRYKDDYLELKKLINTVQERVRHPHRIPVAGTNLAFLPGHIIHTNELTVLLGDNVFALRSTKQANDIIDRRLNNINDNLSKNQDAKRKAEDWLKTTRDHKKEKEEFVEIIETVPSTK